MKSIKTLVATAAIACFSVGASAMQPLAEEQLSEVTGQAISVLADLKLEIGSVTYTDTNLGNEGSFTASGVTASGLLAVTLDLLTNANFTADVLGLTINGTPVNTVFADAAAVNAALGQDGFYDGVSDVVKITVPQLNIPAATNLLLDVAIADMSMGNTLGATYGSLEINDINPQGTTVYIWAH